jgi:hypothetical protein
VSLFDSGIRPAIDAHLLALAAEKRDYGEFWSASSAGYCQRKTMFERLGVPHVEKDDDARTQRIFTAGHLFHAWIQGVTKEANLSESQEIELEDAELMVRGHYDDLVQVDGTYILYDYKTVSSQSFKYKHDLSYYHRMQLGTYLYMLNNLHVDLKLSQVKEGRILLISKDDLRMKEQQLLWDAQLESDVLSYWNSLNAHWKAKTLPACTCDAHEGGFMAKEKWNPYFMYNEPCSLQYYQEWKEKQDVKN